MRKILACAAVAIAALFGVLSLSASTALAGTVPGCAGTHGCDVYKLTGITTGHAAANVSPNGVALGTTNSPVAGSPLELRNFSTTRASLQFVLNSNGELQLGGTSLCVTGRLHTADLETCSAPTVWNSQNWTLSGGIFTNERGRSLTVSADTAYTAVTTSDTGHATWSTTVITS